MEIIDLPDPENSFEPLLAILTRLKDTSAIWEFVQILTGNS